MSRLYDRIMRRADILDVLGNREEADPELTLPNADEIAVIRNSLESAIVVAADDVARYWHATLGREWLWWQDLPALSLPLSPVFIEARYPGWPPGHEIHVREKPEHIIQPPYAVGVLGEMGELGEEEAIKIDGEHPPRWWGRFLVFDEWTKGGPKPGLIFEIRYDSNGRFHQPTGDVGEISPFWAHIDGDSMGSLAVRWCMPLMLAVSFMHCKNVTLPEIVPPPKAAKKAEKRHGKPLTRYRVLEIHAMRDVLRIEGGASQAGLKHALHICRGHFATYSPDKPLFGKHSGTFWKPQHVRGSKAHGEVVKDYAVKAPAE